MMTRIMGVSFPPARTCQAAGLSESFHPLPAPILSFPLLLPPSPNPCTSPIPASPFALLTLLHPSPTPLSPFHSPAPPSCSHILAPFPAPLSATLSRPPLAPPHPPPPTLLSLLSGPLSRPSFPLPSLDLLSCLPTLPSHTPAPQFLPASFPLLPPSSSGPPPPPAPHSPLPALSPPASAAEEASFRVFWRVSGRAGSARSIWAVPCMRVCVCARTLLACVVCLRVRERVAVYAIHSRDAPPVEWGPLLGAGPLPLDSDNDSDMTWGPAVRGGPDRRGPSWGPAVRSGPARIHTPAAPASIPPPAHTRPAAKRLRPLYSVAAGSVFHLLAVWVVSCFDSAWSRAGDLARSVRGAPFGNNFPKRKRFYSFSTRGDLARSVRGSVSLGALSLICSPLLPFCGAAMRLPGSGVF